MPLRRPSEHHPDRSFMLGNIRTSTVPCSTERCVVKSTDTATRRSARRDAKKHIKDVARRVLTQGGGAHAASNCAVLSLEFISWCARTER
eukprot:14095358-Alexandrium_andersonii.AAC.1